ncbi:MAG: AIPR family protein [Bradyrhizobium sp.]|uniref:AIPR family protein n=1 Tax=Bradyrhizobium sp. TaxID=376 RepID=UPI003BF37246
MDVVTQSLLREFAQSQKIESRSESDQFEAFINYIVISDIYPEEFDFGIVSTREGEFGIDGIAIIVNDAIVDDEEQLEDIVSHAPVLQVQFVFVQAKTSSGFDSGEMSKFFQAVLDFFASSEARFNQNDRIRELQQIKNRLYGHAAKFVRGLPKLALHYATTGTWADDKNLCAIRDGFLAQLNSTHMFAATAFHPLDATRVQKLYFQTKNAFRISINFAQNLSLPEIPNVRESYIGLIPISEYLKMITDDDGNVRRRLFFDNIRDFQGDTPVNKSISATLLSDSSIEFPLRNNGVTIVTRKLQRVGTQFTLEDFQIVNGCQTSHVIAAESVFLGNQAIMIPIKVIATEDEEITRQVIIASNQQNKVDEESFWALDPIHKSIEIYFESKHGDQRLYYERRPGQFNTVVGVEKVRVITKDQLLKVYASVFLEQPNQVGRYYKDLTPLIGKEIFSSDHEVHSYYTAAYIGYRLEFMFRNRRMGSEWKPFRFQLAMAARLILERDLKLNPKRRRSQAYCSPIDMIMADPDKAQAVFELGTKAISAAVLELKEQGAELDRRTAKMRDMRDQLRATIASG